jgi:hypothetical protein
MCSEYGSDSLGLLRSKRGKILDTTTTVSFTRSDSQLINHMNLIFYPETYKEKSVEVNRKTVLKWIVRSLVPT